MNNDERASLLFLHNRFFVRVGLLLPAAAAVFLRLRPDPKA
jgi:hypothetical protein